MLRAMTFLCCFKIGTKKIDIHKDKSLCVCCLSFLIAA